MQLIGSKLLIVEDVQDTQNLLRFHLTNAGADVVIAENGQEACDIIAKQKESQEQFDVVLMDMQMPLLAIVKNALQQAAMIMKPSPYNGTF